MAQLQTTVGLHDDGAQQFAGYEGLITSVERRGTIGEIPEGILAQPVLIDVIIIEEVVERDLLAQFRVLQTGGQTEQVVVQSFAVDVVVDVGRIVEQLLHGVSPSAVLLAVGHITVLGLHRCNPRLQSLVGGHHIMAVGQCGILEETEIGIQLHKLHQGVVHRQDAAHRGAAAGIDEGAFLENRREAVVHPLDDVSMLLGTQRGQFAYAVLRVLVHQTDAAQHVDSQRREFAVLFGLLQHAGHILEVEHTSLMARAVPAEVTDVEGPLAIGGRGQFVLPRAGIDRQVTGREPQILLEFLPRRLGSDSHCRSHQAEHPDQPFHRS